MHMIFRSAGVSRLAARVTTAAALGFAVTSLAPFACNPARADVISVFTVLGAFRDGVSLGGTFTLDSTTGVITASNLSVPETLITDVVYTHPKEPTPTSTRFLGQDSVPNSLYLVFPVASLVGYQGGGLTPDSSFFLPAGGGDELQLFYGTATLQSSEEAVPEPSTWAMLIAGLGGLGLVRRRTARRRRL
jgi:hypothetical protein